MVEEGALCRRGDNQTQERDGVLADPVEEARDVDYRLEKEAEGLSGL